MRQQAISHSQHSVNANVHARAHIHSFEGGIYLLEIEQNGVSEWISDKSDQSPKRFKSLALAKECAIDFGAEEIKLNQDTAYDEMIGLASCS